MNLNGNMISFDVPFNGDSELVKEYCLLKDYIFMVYGRAEDGYPQGRKTNMLPPITLDNIFKQVKILKDSGIKFNYLINGTSFENREYDKKFRSDFVSYVRKLASHGIEAVTIGNHFLLEVIANEIPEIELFVSVLMEVDCVSKLKEMKNLGVKYVCLSKILLKDFNSLESISENIGDDLQVVLLANDPCFHNCAFTMYHNNTLSSLTGSSASCDSYCRLHCTRNFLLDSREIISASFIRPEDLIVYFNLGYHRFKLCDRKQTTDWIVRALNAYISECYEGNLADIMAPWNKRNGEYDLAKELNESDFSSNVKKELRNHLRFKPFIDNRKLDGYLDFWRDNKPNGCRNEDCNLCNYCLKMANESITTNEKNNGIIVDNIDLAIKLSTEISKRKK